MNQMEIRLLDHAACHAAEFRVHPLGFYYLINCTTVDITRRVHVWLKLAGDRPINDIHNHSYDVESLVALGMLRNDLFHFTENANGMILEFRVSYKAGNSFLQSTGKHGAIETVKTFQTPAGKRYRLRAGLIHRAVVTAGPCVTVLKTLERGYPIHSYGPVCAASPFFRRAVSRAEVERISLVLNEALQSADG